MRPATKHTLIVITMILILGALFALIRTFLLGN